MKREKQKIALKAKDNENFMQNKENKKKNIRCRKTGICQNKMEWKWGKKFRIQPEQEMESLAVQFANGKLALFSCFEAIQRK